MRILYAGVSDSQWFWAWNGPALANTWRIAFLPLYVLPAIVNVAFGAHRDIIRSTFFRDAALCQVFSIWSILYRSASFCALEPEPLPQAALPAIRAHTPMSAAVTSNFFMPHLLPACALETETADWIFALSDDARMISCVFLWGAHRDSFGLALDHRDHVLGEQLLRLDRLPVLDAAGIRRDRDLGQPLADLDRLPDPLDHVVRRADPDDVARDHLVVRRRRELLHDPRGVEAVAGRVERVGRRHRVLGQRRRVPLEEAAHVPLSLAPGELGVVVDVAGVDPDDVRRRAVLRAFRAVEVELVLERGVREQ